MKKTLARAAQLLSASVFVALLGAMPATAQTSSQNQAVNGFRISPIRSELTIEKGKSQTITIGVENPTTSPSTVKAIINDFVAGSDESGQPKLILDDKAPKPKNDFSKLVGDIPNLSLKGNERKTVDVKISVPADATPGGYYGAIRFAPAGSTGPGNVGLVASVGSLVLVTVPGNLTERMNLIQISASQNDKAKSFMTSGDVSVLIRLKNTGDIHVKPFGRVSVKNMFGKEVASYEVNNTDPRSNVLPDSIRAFTNPLPKGKKWFGRYTVEANIGYNQGSGDVLYAKASFWYLPTWFLYAFVIAIVALVAGGYFFVRRIRSRTRR